jgi:hypothetical protein
MSHRSNGWNSWMFPIGLCISLCGHIRSDTLVNWSLKTMWVPMFEWVFAHFWVFIGSLWYLEGLVTLKFGSRTYNQSLLTIETQAWTKLLSPTLFTKSKFFWYITKYEFYKKETIKPNFLQVGRNQCYKSFLSFSQFFMECNVDETNFDLKQHWVPLLIIFRKSFELMVLQIQKKILKIVKKKVLLNKKYWNPKTKGSFQNQELDNISLNLHK